MPDIGRDGGVTGLIDLPGLGSGQKFVVRVYQYEQSLTAGTESQGARGDTAFVPSQYTTTTGSVVVRGKMMLAGYPIPTPFNGVTGTLTIQYHTGVTETVAVRVLSTSISHAEPTTDVADITLACEITAEPSFTGFGTGAQTTAAATTGTTRELWAGISKSIDPQSLIEGATQVFDVYGVTDSDAGEVSAISAAISAATTPVSNLKLRPMSMSRVNAYRIRLTYTWSRTSTADDVLLPIRKQNIDAGNLASSETVAAINATAAASTLTGTTLVSRTVTRLHDNAVLNVADYGPRTATQAEEMGRTGYQTDTTELDDGEEIAVVHNTGVAPSEPTPTNSDLVLVDKKITPLTSLKSVTVFKFARTTTQNAAIYGKAFVKVDPAGLESAAATAAINATAAPASGFVSRGSTTINLTPQHTLVTTEGGLRTTAEDIERPGTWVVTDPSGLEGNAQTMRVFTTGSEPSDASQTAAGLTLAATTVRYEHSGKGVKTWKFAENTAKQDREYANTETKVATGTVGSESTRAEVWDSTGAAPSAPSISGQKLRFYVDKPLTADRTLRVWQFGISDLVDDIENAKFRYVVCPSGIRDEEVAAQVWLASGSAPTTPTPTNTSLQLAETTDIKYDELYKVRIWTFRRDTPETELENRATDAGFDTNYTPYSTVGTLASSTASAESQAAGLVSTYRNSGLFQSVRVVKPTPNTLLTEVKNFTASFCATTMSANGEPRLMLCRTTAAGGTAQIFIRDTVKVDANRRWYLIQPVVGTYADGYMDLTVRRSVTGYLPLETAWYGTTNAVSFAGMLANTLQLVGTSIQDNPSAPLPRMAHLIYRFYYDSRGHYDQSAIPTEWFMATTTGSPVAMGTTGTWATATGWTNAVNVGIAVPLLPVATFTGLIP